MSITIGTVNKDGTGSTLAIKIPMHAYHTAATTTSSHTGARWGFFKATDFTYNQITGNVTGPGGGSRFAYYNWLSGDQIELEHPDVNGGVAQLVTILSKVNNNTVAVSTAYHGASLVNVTAYVGIEPLGDLVYRWDTPGAATYTNTDPDPTGLRSSTIDPTRWYGPHTICHHYEAAGTHIITLTVNDYANSESATKSITVTATAPSWTTRYISPSGDDATGDGLTLATAWQTWKKGVDQIALINADRRLFVDGGTYPDLTASVTYNSESDHTLIIWNGSGTKPVVPCVSYTAISTTAQSSNLRVVDIDFTKTSNANGTGAIGLVSDDTMFLRTNVTNSSGVGDCFLFTGTLSAARTAIIDCAILQSGGTGLTYGIFGYGGVADANRTGRAIVACSVTAHNVHAARLAFYRGIIAYSTFELTGNNVTPGNALRFEPQGTGGTIVGDNYIWRCNLKSTTATNGGGVLSMSTATGSSASFIVDSCYLDAGTNGATNVIIWEVNSPGSAFRNNIIRRGTTALHFNLVPQRRIAWVNNSSYQSIADAKGLRCGESTDGGVDDLHILNCIFSMVGTDTTAQYVVTNVGNSAYPDRESTFFDYNLIYNTDATTPDNLLVVRTWTTVGESTAATYEDVGRTLTEVGAWTGAWVSGGRVLPIGVVPQNANNNMRLWGSKTSNDIIVVGGGAGAGWGAPYSNVPAKAQTKADTNVAQLTDWTAIKAAETHNLGGVGASAVDPLFIDPATGNLQLDILSPARGVGLALPFNRFDYRGAERYTGSGETADMGAIAYATVGTVSGHGRGRGRRRGNTWP